MDSQALYTCLSCSIAFPSPEEQREHYRSDHHRYNMKRRVAGLPPISATLFNQRVLERKAETAITTTPKSLTCELCSKAYTSENSYWSHLQSKKHKERELKGPAPPKAPKPAPEVEQPPPAIKEEPEDEEDAVIQSIDEKIAAARARLSPLDCLFCSNKSDSFENNLTHMSTAHSFFIPDAEYLVDLQGLVAYLGEKIMVGNVCLYCNERGKAFRTVDAVWKHMVDKGHCKIAYESQSDRLEVSDFYDFSTSYPDGPSKKNAEEWEDVSDEDEDADEVVDDSDASGSEEEEELPENQLTYGDSEFELVLPSGARIGHRSMRRYYAQSFHPVGKSKDDEDPNTGAALVRKLLADKNSALVPRKGGFGAFGSGGEVVKARNRGEAREAGRHVREFRDMKRREDFKTKVGFVHNSQKHFRDPLLQ
ncbi:hypothetical protein MD484_g7160, partial [Candolleomyces efflorescens]